MLPVEQPFKVYTDLNGEPLDTGSVYIGLPNQNPITSPVTVFWDAAGTQPAAQPLQVLNGYIVRAGTPANVFYSGEYSILIRNKFGAQVFYSQTSNDYSFSSYVGLLSSSAGASNIGTPSGTVQSVLDGLTSSINGQRQRLSGSRDYYVRPDGNDSNSGTINNAANAWLTMQHAHRFIADTLDLNGFSVTVHVADGTYTAGVNATAPYVGEGVVYFIGNTTTPSNCIINANAVGAFYAECNARYDIRGFRVTNSAGDGVYVQNGGVITIGGKMEYGPCSASQITTGGGGSIVIQADYTITAGTSTSHLHAGSPGSIIAGVINVTLTGAPNYTSYFAGAAEGTITVKDTVFTGAATGPTHLAHKGGVIDTHPAFASLPGSTPGRVATGGIIKGSQATPFPISPDNAANNSVRLQSYNTTTGLFTDRVIVDAQPTGSGGGSAWAYINGDDSYMTGRSHFAGATAAVAVGNALSGLTINSGASLFMSMANTHCANWRRDTSDGAVHQFYRGGAGASVVGSISVTASATAYNTSSDYRLKDYIGPVHGAWERVKAIKTADFEFKSAPGTVVHGFIAHELAETHPTAVTGTKDAMEPVLDEDGNLIGEVPAYQGIDPSKLIGDLTAALQEAMSRIEALESAAKPAI